jgi:PQQ-dependent dehydrogenase (methanol/ethanol family)
MKLRPALLLLAVAAVAQAFRPADAADDRAKALSYLSGAASLLAKAQVAGVGPRDELNKAGAAVFAASCSSCHGQDGAGGRAVALADNRRIRAMSDPEIAAIIRNGAANGMPPFPQLAPAALDDVTAYVRSLNPAPSDAPAVGDAAAGAQLFFGSAKCASCHMVHGRGASIGPDLSNVGRQMTPIELSRALREPGASIARGYALARVQFKDGRTVRGFVRNEGNYVLPLQDLNGGLTLVDKRTAMITRERGSFMPPHKASDEEHWNVVAFLAAGAPLPRELAETRSTGADAPGAAAKAFDEILKPRPGDWPTYHGRLDGNRHSAHTQINTTNVSRLSMQWVHSLRGFENETTPLVLDGLMYVTATNQVSALDAATGREIWRFSRPRTPGVTGDAGIGFNRGAAVLGSRVFLVTDNAHLLALSRTNGTLLWEVVLPENTSLPYGGTMAPLAIGNLVIAGVSGGDGGIRGFLAAYHADTGRQAWRFWTVPARGEPGSETWKGSADLEKGGGATWLTGSYDAESGTLYWPTGNPYPDTDGSERGGDNWYTDAVVALDAETGKLRWHFQFTPHDLWDWDAQEPLVLVDALFQGKPRKLLLQANRNGFFYVLDRTNGQFLHGSPFVQKLTWASGIGRDGRPVIVPGNTPNEEGVTTCPAIRGATNWMSTSYHPATKLFYVVAVENCFVYRSTMFGGGRRGGAAPPARGTPPAAPPARGRGAAPAGNFGLPEGGFNRGGPGGGGSMALRAINIETGRTAWEIAQVGNSNNYGGTLSTDGGLVFYGQASGEFAAVDAKSGAHLWHFETQEIWKSSPITYVVNGKQYVATASGPNILAFALP